MGSNGYLDQNDQRPSVDSDHQSRNSTGKPMLLNDSKRSKSNPRRHSSIIPASAKITHNNNIIPSPNYLRASTGSCHDFCKFGRKKLSEEVKPWRCIQKQSPKVENFPQKHAEIPVIEVLPEKVDEDDVTEKEKSFCEKIEAEKKIKVFNRKPTVAVESKAKPWISQKDIVIKNTERVEKKLAKSLDVSKVAAADFGRIKPVIKLGKSFDISKAAATSKTQKPPSPSPSPATAGSRPPAAAASRPPAAAASRPPAAAASRPPAAAASRPLAPAASRPLAAAASRPNKLVSTKRLAKTNGARNSSPQQQQPLIKKRMVGIPEESKNNEKSKSQEKSVIKLIVESEKNSAVESNENGYMTHEEESNNENSQQKMDQIVESEENPSVESNENGYMIHEEESNNENSQQKMDQIVQSEENPSVESNENGDTMEVEELSEDDDETEEDEYEYEYENSINSQSSSEEDEKEETFNGGKRPKKIAEDNTGSEDGVKLKFRRGRVVDIEAEGKDSPRRLKFRRGRVENHAEGRSSVKIRNFRKRTTTTVTNNEDIDSEIIMLRHQDVEEKKDAQGLFNNVIEETASKLVEARKSKVKALVGAFETVISLQETTTSSNTKHSSPQTLIS